MPRFSFQFVESNKWFMHTSTLSRLYFDMTNYYAQLSNFANVMNCRNQNRKTRALALSTSFLNTVFAKRCTRSSSILWLEYFIWFLLSWIWVFRRKSERKVIEKCLKNYFQLRLLGLFHHDHKCILQRANVETTFTIRESFLFSCLESLLQFIVSTFQRNIVSTFNV